MMKNLLNKINNMIEIVKNYNKMGQSICVISDILFEGKEIMLSDEELKLHKFDVLYIQGDGEKIRNEIKNLSNLFELKKYCVKNRYSLGALPGSPENVWEDE